MKNRFPRTSLAFVALTYAAALHAQTNTAQEPPADAPPASGDADRPAPPPAAPPADAKPPASGKASEPSAEGQGAQKSEPWFPPDAPQGEGAAPKDGDKGAPPGEPPAKDAPAAAAGGESEPTSGEEKAPVTDAEATEPKQLAAVVVQATALTTSDEAAEKVYEVAGGANLIRSSTLTKGTLGTIGDALKNQPGVYAESVNGGEATRLSIRGSGIVRSGFLFGWGNQLNLDGQRLYGASGNPYEAIEPLAVDHIEVLRGANAFEYGPLSLGGSINYVTKTGYDASPFYARLEAGAFNYFREQVSSGDVVGPFDYYVSITRFDKGGYRDNTESYSTRLVSNVGYQFSDKVKTRFHFRFAEQYQEDAGFLTWAQLQDNPRQSQFSDVRQRVNPGTFVVGNTTSFQLDSRSNLEIGVQYDDSPIDSYGGPASPFFVFQQIAGSVRYKREDEVFGRESKTLVSFIAHRTLKNSWKSIVNETQELAAIRPAEQGDWTLLATNDTRVTNDLWLVAGLAGIYQTRETSVSEGQNLVGQSISRHYLNVAPKLGFRFEATKTAQVYGNVSRAIDTPSANSYIRTDATYVPQEFLGLEETRATTVEVGTKGRGGRDGIFDWNLSFYRSWIEDELLTVQIAPTVTTASNASPTIHQGVEAGLDTTLWTLAGDNPDPNAAGQTVVLRQSYTWNDFRFVDDDRFGENKLAGVPIHLYRAELAYEHPIGFYAGTNVVASLAKFPVDFANTVYNDRYTVLGAKIGYFQPKKGLEVFVEGRNLLDERYAPVVAPIFDGASGDPAVYAPAEGRAINGGVAYRY